MQRNVVHRNPEKETAVFAKEPFYVASLLSEPQLNLCLAFNLHPDFTTHFLHVYIGKAPTMQLLNSDTCRCIIAERIFLIMYFDPSTNIEHNYLQLSHAYLNKCILFPCPLQNMSFLFTAQLQ